MPQLERHPEKLHVRDPCRGCRTAENACIRAHGVSLFVSAVPANGRRKVHFCPPRCGSEMAVPPDDLEEGFCPAALLRALVRPFPFAFPEGFDLDCGTFFAPASWLLPEICEIDAAGTTARLRTVPSSCPAGCTEAGMFEDKLVAANTIIENRLSKLRCRIRRMVLTLCSSTPSRRCLWHIARMGLTFTGKSLGEDQRSAWDLLEKSPSARKTGIGSQKAHAE